MKTNSDLIFKQALSSSFEIYQKSHQGLKSLNLRKQFLEEALDQGLPNSHHEAWKYTSLQEFSQFNFSTEEKPPSTSKSVTANYNPYLLPNFVQIIFVNGQLLMAIPPTTDFELKSVEDFYNKTSSLESSNKDTFALINSAFASAGAYLEIKSKCFIQLVFINSVITEQMKNIRNYIYLYPGVEAHIVETYINNSPSKLFCNTQTEVHLDKNSNCHYGLLGKHTGHQMHLHQLDFKQSRDSVSDIFNFIEGADWSRLDLKVNLKDENAKTAVNGLYFGKAQQKMDFRIDVRHFNSNTESSQLYKGVLSDEAKAVVNGRIYIAPHSQKVQSKQLNHGLLLSEKAEINTKPELEVWADDVKANHGASIGQINDDELFYLKSRGIDANSAKSLLAKAFVQEVAGQITSEPLRNYFRRQVDESFQNFYGDKNV